MQVRYQAAPRSDTLILLKMKRYGAGESRRNRMVPAFAAVVRRLLGDLFSFPSQCLEGRLQQIELAAHGFLWLHTLAADLERIADVSVCP